MLNPGKVWELVKAAFTAWREVEAPSMGGTGVLHHLFDRVTSAPAAGWVLGYALKRPIESQVRRARRWFARF